MAINISIPNPFNMGGGSRGGGGGSGAGYMQDYLNFLREQQRNYEEQTERQQEVSESMIEMRRRDVLSRTGYSGTVNVDRDVASTLTPERLRERMRGPAGSKRAPLSGSQGDRPEPVGGRSFSGGLTKSNLTEREVYERAIQDRASERQRNILRITGEEYDLQDAVEEFDELLEEGSLNKARARMRDIIENYRERFGRDERFADMRRRLAEALRGQEEPEPSPIGGNTTMPDDSSGRRRRTPGTNRNDYLPRPSGGSQQNPVTR